MNIAGPHPSGLSPVTLDVEGEPMAVLPMRLNGDALSDLVILQKGQRGPTVVVTAASATFTVNSTGDQPHRGH